MKSRLLTFAILGALMTASIQPLAAQEEGGLDDIITESSDMREDQFLNDIVENRLVIESTVLPYEELREADIPWKKRIWRVLDVREKMNQHFINEELPFFDIIRDAGLNGEITLFAGDDKSFSEPLYVEEVQKLLRSVDTTQVPDPETFDLITTIKVNEVYAENIERFRIKEVWYFNKEESVVKVRILGIAPMYREFDSQSGAFVAEYPLFWVYYPQAREILARHRVFNPNNDAAPLTWYDIFEQRQFSSYIWKESNPLDAHLAALGYEGIDLLLESEKIESELFNFEHDLWSY